jgi:hypothetical protein
MECEVSHEPFSGAEHVDPIHIPPHNLFKILFNIVACRPVASQLPRNN